jgi:hypothetical protein
MNPALPRTIFYKDTPNRRGKNEVGIERNAGFMEVSVAVLKPQRWRGVLSDGMPLGFQR